MEYAFTFTFASRELPASGGDVRNGALFVTTLIGVVTLIFDL